jgi:CheY-like chemotaxis protein
VPSADSQSISLAGCKALVVDDDSETGAITQEYLNLLGCRAEISHRSAAVEKLHEAANAGDPFLVVVFDMSSPEPDDSAPYHDIASDPAIAGTVRIGCTDTPVRGDRRLRKFGFAGVLQKPIDPALLHDTLIAALEERATPRYQSAEGSPD